MEQNKNTTQVDINKLIQHICSPTVENFLTDYKEYRKVNFNTLSYTPQWYKDLWGDFIEPYYNKLIEDTMDSDTGLPRIYLIQNNEFLNKTKDDIDRNKVENHVKNIIGQWKEKGADIIYINYEEFEIDGKESKKYMDMATNYIYTYLKRASCGRTASINFIINGKMHRISTVILSSYIDKISSAHTVIHESAHALQFINKDFFTYFNDYNIDVQGSKTGQSSELYFGGWWEYNIWTNYRQETHADLLSTTYILLSILAKNKELLTDELKYRLIHESHFCYGKKHQYKGYNSLPIFIDIIEQPAEKILEQFKDCINNDKSIDIYKLFDITKDIVLKKEKEYRTWFLQNNVRLSLVLNLKAIKIAGCNYNDYKVPDDVAENLKINAEEYVKNFDNKDNPIQKDNIKIDNFIKKTVAWYKYYPSFDLRRILSAANEIRCFALDKEELNKYTEALVALKNKMKNKLLKQWKEQLLANPEQFKDIMADLNNIQQTTKEKTQLQNGGL